MSHLLKLKEAQIDLFWIFTAKNNLKPIYKFTYLVGANLWLEIRAGLLPLRGLTAPLLPPRGLTTLTLLDPPRGLECLGLPDRLREDSLQADSQRDVYPIQDNRTYLRNGNSCTKRMEYDIFEEGSQISTNHKKRENSAFLRLIEILPRKYRTLFKFDETYDPYLTVSVTVVSSTTSSTSSVPPAGVPHLEVLYCIPRGM